MTNTKHHLKGTEARKKWDMNQIKVMAALHKGQSVVKRIRKIKSLPCNASQTEKPHTTPKIRNNLEAQLMRYCASNLSFLVFMGHIALWDRFNCGKARPFFGCGVILLHQKGRADHNFRTWRGQTVWLEYKSPEGKQSTEQRRFQSIVEKIGDLYFIIRSRKDYHSALLVVDVDSTRAYLELPPAKEETCNAPPVPTT